MASDRAKIWILNLTIILSGLLMGVAMINALLFWLAQAALIISIVRFRYLYAVFPAIIAMAMAMIVYGNIAGVAYAYMVLLPGVIMGYKARTFNTPRSILLWGMAPYILPVVLLIMFYSQLVAVTPTVLAQMQTIFQQNGGLLGISAGDMEMMQTSLENIIPWILKLAPGIIFTSFVGLALFAYIGAAAVNSWFGALLPKTYPLYTWKASEIWLAPLAVTLIFMLFGNDGLQTIGQNMLVFIVHLYAFFGICLFDFYLKKINIPLPMRLLIYLFMLIAVVVAIPVLAFVAVIDSYFDFRKARLQS